MAPQSSALFAGTVINFNFVSGIKELYLIDIIGAGGCATVYRAVDLGSSGLKPIYYAVKCSTRPDRLSPARYTSRLWAEYELQTRVSEHPTVLPLLSFSYGEFSNFFVFDYKPGGTLLSAVIIPGFFGGKDDHARSLFLQLVDAVQACHNAGVYHRDIKPENMLLSEDGKSLYLSDFGMATYRSSSREFRCGSIRFMSPGSSRLPLILYVILIIV